MSRRTLSDKARDLSDRALDVITEIMEDPLAENRDRLRAAEAIHDRGYGKAAQAVIALPADRLARQAAAMYSDEQLDNIIEAEIIRREDMEALPAPVDPLLE